MSIYSQPIVPSEWEQTWFLMYGRVHPYALTWEIEPDEGLDAGEAPLDYCIPALIVRDQGYQPIAPRALATVDEFPVMPPIVSFTGPILGSGRTLLHDEAISGLGNTQRKCCGFVQLSTFIAPGNPAKTPFRGFHPFQVFVIFPIHANPWTSLCKRMADKTDTHFQPNTLFSCTGKVAGFLNHRIMVHPPQLAQDCVFIVVPDAWTFCDKAALESMSVSASVDAPAKRASADPLAFDRMKFMTPSKRAAPPLKRSSPSPDWPSPITPLKKQRSSPLAQASAQSSESTSATADISYTDATTDSPSPQASPPLAADHGTSITTPDPSSPLGNKGRPHRNRHPPKKYWELD
ncbi:hypothetical protein B0J12DRAFT_679897 [Macrophomina phaseolina]|uniref:Uncharacterized protein n=1 Tax=Macrophomina phaseolina TaxID=35725 RepID=A0ABQ8FXU3_9PEZI|nr:hypothetical protein B0J12DRAFT_679897 [Macrophomina phaseolina]